MRKEDKSRSLEEVQAEIEKIQAELKDVHGTETEVYARIVGYYRAVKNWNKGKKDESSSEKPLTLKIIQIQRQKQTHTSLKKAPKLHLKALPEFQLKIMQWKFPLRKATVTSFSQRKPVQTVLPLKIL